MKFKKYPAPSSADRERSKPAMRRDVKPATKYHVTHAAMRATAQQLAKKSKVPDITPGITAERASGNPPENRCDYSSKKAPKCFIRADFSGDTPALLVCGGRKNIAKRVPVASVDELNTLSRKMCECLTTTQGSLRDRSRKCIGSSKKK